MKYFKALGLAAVAAMVMMAFGAGSASAETKICVSAIATGNGCPTNKAEPNPSTNVHIEARVTPPGAELTTNITNVICEESFVTLHLDTSTNVKPATSITGQVTNLTFAKCKTSGGQACTVEVINLPYPTHLEGTIDGTTNTSRLTATDEVGAGAKVVCGFVINCTFTTKHASLEGHNISLPRTTTEFTAVKVPLNRAGGICPAVAEWDAKYEVITPAGFTVH